MIGLICATGYEANEIIERYGLIESEGTKNLKVYENNDIVLVVSGIGKVMATIGVAYITQKFECEYVINIGVVGGCKEEYVVADVLLPTQVMQYDVELPFRNNYTNVIYAPLDLNNPLASYQADVIVCATGDKALDVRKKTDMGSKLAVDIVDMELFAIAKYMEEIGKLESLLSIKGVSDSLKDEYKLENLFQAMENVLIKLDEVLKNLQ